MSTNFPVPELNPSPIYPPVDLTKAKYAETSKIGLGRNGIYALFGIDDTDKGAIFSVLRWDVVDGDYLSLWINDEERVGAPVTRGENSHYLLEVPAEKVPEGDCTYFARVRRALSGNEVDSEVQSILFKTTIPGGYDDDDTQQWHSGLAMELGNFKPGAILTPTNTADGLQCLIMPYENIRKNDKIIVRVGGTIYVHTVDGEQAKQPPTQPIVVTVPVEVLRNLNPSGEVKVYFTVLDVVNNEPFGRFPYSQPIVLNSEMYTYPLAPPYVMVDGQYISELDLDTQSGATLEVEVELKPSTVLPKPPNKVKVHVETTDKYGATETLTHQVDDNNRRFQIIPLPAEWMATFKQLAGGSFRVWYEQIKSDGVFLRRSNSTSIGVVGTPSLMPAPIITLLEAGLFPLNTHMELVLPPYQPHDPSYTETVKLQHIDVNGGGALVISRQQAGAQGGTRLILMEALKVFEGKGVCQAFYETDDGKGTPGSVRQSEKLNFEIGVRVPTLPPMTVPAILDNNIDPATVPGANWLMYIPYAGTVVGDKVYWTVSGKSTVAGSIDITSSLEGVQLTTLEIPIDTSFLVENNNRSIRISYSVVHAGPPKTTESSMVLNPTVGAAVELGVLKILEADPTTGSIRPITVKGGATLRISYKLMLPGDVITYTWRGQYGYSQFKAVAAADPATNSINVVIPANVIARGVHPSGNAITVECEVKRGQVSHKFQPLNVLLLPLKVFPTPYIVGFENQTVLPVSELPAEATIKVAPWEFISEGQLYWVTVEGTLATGIAYTEDLAIAKPLTVGDLTNGVSLPLSADKVRALQDNSVFNIRVWVSFPEIPIKQVAIAFEAASYVVQLLPTELPFPTLNGAPSMGQTVTVDPLMFKDSTRVTVKYLGMLATDSIIAEWIHWNGTKVTLTLNGMAGGSVVFDFTSHEVIHNSVNSVVQLRYSIVRSGKTLVSQVQTVTVGTIATARLLGALINGLASGAALTMNTFSGDAKASVPAWPLIKAGQKVYLSLLSGGRELKVLGGHVVTMQELTNGIVNKPVLRSWLQRVIHNTPITVKLSVGFDGSTDMARATPFLTTTYQMLNLPDFTNFQDGTLNGWELGTAGKGGAITGAPGSRVWTQTTGSGLSQYQGYVLIKRITPLPGHRYRLSFAVRQLNVGTTTPKLRLTVGYSTTATFAVSSGNWQEYSHAAVNNGEDHFAVHSDEPTWSGNDFEIAWLRIEKI
ncbi:hypothetical protein [Pseudomonas fluorescens]|uniref:hypothetical protein n=1 Tax=Pseudomonas fluorescens TaxID=294 RepID=UPI0002FA63BC|nr:hypothetical protein [Pseudomonas fluorescens]